MLLVIQSESNEWTWNHSLTITEIVLSSPWTYSDCHSHTIVEEADDVLCVLDDQGSDAEKPQNITRVSVIFAERN